MRYIKNSTLSRQPKQSDRDRNSLLYTQSSGARLTQVRYLAVQNWLRPAAARLTQTRILRPAKDASDRPLGKLTTLEHSRDHTPNT